MNYKTYEKNNDIYFKYKNYKKIDKFNKSNNKLSDSPFKKLVQLNLK